MKKGRKGRDKAGHWTAPPNHETLKQIEAGLLRQEHAEDDGINALGYSASSFLRLHSQAHREEGLNREATTRPRATRLRLAEVDGRNVKRQSQVDVTDRRDGSFSGVHFGQGSFGPNPLRR